MIWTVLDNWIVAIAVLVSVSCALPGCFLVLRRMSMMGDAISHAVLPGLAVAFFVTGSRASLPMFLGAVAVGVLTAVLTQWIQQWGRVESSAALGTVFSSLFALGLVLIRLGGADAVDLDVDCVLYGAIELAPLHTAGVFGWHLPTAALTNGAMLLVNLLFVGLFYKELKVSSFDPQLATTLGINAQAMHYVLMGLVAATVVAAFESVGSILVIAMLIVPPAAAYLLTDRLAVMLLLAGGLAAASAVLGHVGAITLPPLIGFEETLTSAMIAVMAGGLFLVALIASPRHGLVSRFARRWWFSVSVLRQDLLALLYRLEERTAAPAGLPIDAQLRQMLTVDRLKLYAAVRKLQRQGLVLREREDVMLTDAGRVEAGDQVRTHRLWESYLDRFAGLPDEHQHSLAERLEHVTDATLQQGLAERTGSPATDPQGRPIPPRRE